MKKTVSLVLTLCVLISSLAFGALGVNEEAVTVNAKAAVLMDSATGQVLFSFNENQQLYPASVTKIMPLLIFMEYLDKGLMSLTDTVTVSANAESKGGSQIWLKAGEEMSVEDMLKATAIASANDACTALGEHISGSEEAFVQLLNDKAKALGMKNTHFDNCTGLDDDTDTHLTTAYDIALMSRELLKYEEIQTYTTTWMDSLREGKTQLVNTNRLVRFYSGTTGLKTGTTSKAGYCLSASAQRDELHLIAVVLGASNSTDRFEGAKAMLSWGFANYETLTPEIEASLLTDIPVIKGEKEWVTPRAKGITSLTVKKGAGANMETRVTLQENVSAPVEPGQTLGKAELYLGEEKIAEYALVASEAIPALTLRSVMVKMLKSMTKGL